MANRPNILLIFPDQHRADVLGSAGNKAAQTPNLDRLAAEGISFTRCMTNSPLCMPARTSLISGQYVGEHGIWSNSMSGDCKGPSHVRNVRDAGYHTAVIGKTHLYTHGRRNTADQKDILVDWGYTDINEFTGPLASGNMGSPWTEYLEGRGLLETWRNYLREHNAAMRAGRAWDEAPCPLPTEAQLDAYTGWNAVEWLRAYRSEKPFYYQVCFPGPHDPYDSPAEYRARYRLQDLPLGITDPPRDPVSPLVGFFRDTYQTRFNMTGWTDEQRRLMKLAYYAKVTLIDHYVGEIMKVLKERGMLENTWVIYTSDHGEFLGERCMIQKMMFFDEALMIPCIVRPPGGARAARSAAMCDQLDIAATICDIAGASPVKDSAGRSLLPNMHSPSAKGKDAVFSEVLGYSMVRTDRFKMSVDAGTGEPVDLFDMADDPREQKNIVHEPALKSTVEDLKHIIDGRLLGRMSRERFAAFRAQMPGLRLGAIGQSRV
jgi:choline-sulfatase